MSEEFVLHLFRQSIELRIKFFVQEDVPLHKIIMYYNAYVVKGIN